RARRPARAAPSRGLRGDVLVEPEHVRGVVTSLDLGQPIPGRARVGVADPLLALVGEEVDVGAMVVLAERPSETFDPGCAAIQVPVTLVERRDIDHDPALA